MPPLPASMHTTARKIYDWYESQKEDHREHLGASLIGHHCDRYLWLTFRWSVSPQFEGRVLRLFGTGKREESRVYDELRAIGVEIHTEENGKQIICRDPSGHFGGSLDGIGLGFPEAPKTWAVLEVKTCNASSFAKLAKSKSVKAEKPQHYAQMQTYMGLMGLDRALYFAVNKDSDDLYTEWVHADKEAYLDALARAKRIVNATTPPNRISEDPANWQCKMCDMYKLCHQKDQAEVNCRTCVHSTPVEGGKWRCNEHEKDLSVEAQRAGCDSHIFIPALVQGTAIDAGDHFVEYFVEGTGETFKNGPAHTKSKAMGKKRKKPEANFERFIDDEIIPF